MSIEVLKPSEFITSLAKPNAVAVTEGRYQVLMLNGDELRLRKMRSDEKPTFDEWFDLPIKGIYLVWGTTLVNLTAEVLWASKKDLPTVENN